jgi:hypothetical protein
MLVRDEPEALIKEARRRTRRRRAIVAALVLAAAAVSAGVAATTWGPSRSAHAGVHSAGGLPYVNLRAFHGHGILAFVSRGRLFVLDGATDTLTAVTGPSQQASSPQFSPDGRWLTYSAVATATTTGEWLARSDGSAPRPLGQAGVWLPDGRLALGRGLFRLSASGQLQRSGSAPADLAAASPDGDQFAFWVGTVTPGTHGHWHEIWRLEVADSLNGHRRVWFSTRVSFTPQSGVHGDVPDGTLVLPHHEGILFWFDPNLSDDADGRPLYELRSPAAPATQLAVTIGAEISLGPNGTLAIGAGPNRYAWRTKTVEICAPATATCAPVPTRAGELSFDPAWSPDGRALAFVQAPPPAHGDFFQSTVTAWYAQHRLWLLHAGSQHAVEIPATQGAAAPTWSTNSQSLLYVSGDALWLIPRPGAHPVKIAAPLFVPTDWPSYYGQIAWTDQFSWSSP